MTTPYEESKARLNALSDKHEAATKRVLAARIELDDAEMALRNVAVELIKENAIYMELEVGQS